MSYDLISRINHWIIAFAMIGMLMFGLYLEYGGLEREARGPLIGIHRSIGILVLIFGTWRVGWRIIQGFPAPASVMPQWQEVTAKWVHWGLLGGIILMPLSGIGLTVFAARDISVFGWFTIPAAAEVAWLNTLSSLLHQYLSLGLCVIVVLHIGAAFKHHWIDRDTTLTRMMFGSKPQ